jgi:nucleoid-associated protein YgaU
VVAIEHPPLLSQTPGARTGNDTDATGRVTDADHGPGDATPVPPVVPPVTDTPGPIAEAGNTGSTAIPPVVPPATDAPPPTSPAPTSALSGSGARTHVMQRGETFSSVAKAVYGKSSYYLKIQQANPGLNPNAIKPGTEIKLPDVTAVSSDTGGTGATNAKANAGSRGGPRESAPAVNSATEYRVQPNDSLYKISMKLYGNGGHVDELYETNAAAIGDDPARLKVGMVLKLHDAPRVASQR